MLELDIRVKVRVGYNRFERQLIHIIKNRRRLGWEKVCHLVLDFFNYPFSQ